MGRGNKKAQQAPLTWDERDRIKGHLYSVACSEAWIDSIMEMICRTDEQGRPLVVKYTTTAQGRLKTKIPKLLEAIADALVYPPAADDVAKCGLDGTEHVGSTMRPCFCDRCSVVGQDGKPARHVHWPAHYMVKGNLSYTCAVNRSSIDPELVEAVDPRSELLDDVGRGRVVSMREAARMRRLDANAWRRDSIGRLRIPAQLATAERALIDHRWTQVVGQVHTDARGRERNDVRLQRRGLKNLGSLSDFLELGRELTEIPGVDAAAAGVIEQLVREYPRTPRMREIRLLWKKTRVGRRSGKRKSPPGAAKNHET